MYLPLVWNVNIKSIWTHSRRGVRTYPRPNLFPTSCCRRSNCWRRKWNKFFFSFAFWPWLCRPTVQDSELIFQLRSSKSNRFDTNQFFIPQMKADICQLSKKASSSNLRLQKMEDISKCTWVTPQKRGFSVILIKILLYCQFWGKISVYRSESFNPYFASLKALNCTIRFLPSKQNSSPWI